MKKWILTAALLLAIGTQAADITLTWDWNGTHNERLNLAGFRIYRVSDTTDMVAQVGTNTPHVATISDLDEGVSYSFLAVALTTRGVESDHSNIYSWQAPAPILAPLENKSFVFRTPNPVGGGFALTAHVSWHPVTNATEYIVQFMSPAASGSAITSGTSWGGTMRDSFPLVFTVVATNSLQQISGPPLTVTFMKVTPPGQLRKLLP
jgi:hypothetical protein